MAIYIKGELVKKGISQTDVAKELGIHPNTLSNKLEGFTSFTIDEAFQIKEKFLPDVDLKCFSKSDKAS